MSRSSTLLCGDVVASHRLQVEIARGQPLRVGDVWEPRRDQIEGGTSVGKDIGVDADSRADSNVVNESLV